MSSLRDWALALPAQGRFTFSTAEARDATGGSEAALAAALGRAEADRLIASPVRGFHVVLPLEDRGVGTPSWQLFLDPLMTHLALPYYVGLLTGASIHGASGQAAQVVQVVTARPRRPVRHGRLAIEFVVRSDGRGRHPSSCARHRRAGCVSATPEVVALDLVRYPAKAAGWGNVAYGAPGPRAVAAPERHAGGDGRRARHVGDPAPRPPARAGGGRRRPAALEAELAERRVGWVPLVPGEPSTGDAAERDGRWRVLVNVEPEAD